MKKRFLTLILTIIMIASFDILLPMNTGAVVRAIGKTASELEYDGVSNFSEGLAAVQKNGKWGCVDRTGKQIAPFIYDTPFTFSGGLAAVTKNTWSHGYIDKSGKEVLFGLYDLADNFSEGFAVVMKNLKYGFIDAKGKEVIPLTYNSAQSFSEGMAAVRNSKNQWGYIDVTGKEIIPCSYDWGEPFSGDLALLQKDLKYGYTDKTGKTAIGFKSLCDACSFSEGLAAVKQDTVNGYGYIDSNGKEIIPQKYNDALPFSEGLAAVNKGQKGYFIWGYIDKTGKEVTPFIYLWAYSFNNGLARVQKQDKKWGYIDKTGKEVIPCIYDDASDFTDGLAFVKKDGKYSILSITTPKVGTPIGDVLYSDITAYINGYVIPTSIINGKTLVVVEDLAKYGFDVAWNNGDRSLKVEQNKNKKFAPLTVIKDIVHKPGTFKCKFLYTDIQTYLSGNAVDSFAIDGRTLIDFELFAKHYNGKLTWNNATREIRAVID